MSDINFVKNSRKAHTIMAALSDMPPLTVLELRQRIRECDFRITLPKDKLLPQLRKLQEVGLLKSIPAYRIRYTLTPAGEEFYSLLDEDYIKTLYKQGEST